MHGAAAGGHAVSDTPRCRFSVLVPVCHGGALLDGLLRSLAPLQVPADGAEVLLVCAQPEPVRDAVRRAGPRPDLPVQVLAAPPGATRAAQLNLAWGAARGQVLLFTDDDCCLPVDWLLQVERAIAAAPAALLAGGPDTTAAPGDAFAAALAEVLHSPVGSGLARTERARHGADYCPRLWNLALTRQAAERIVRLRNDGPETLFAPAWRVHEDVELAVAARRCGCEVRFLPACGVGHHRDTTWARFGVDNLRMAAACRRLGLQRGPHRLLLLAGVLFLLLLLAACLGMLHPAAPLAAAGVYGLLLAGSGLVAAVRHRRPRLLLLVPPLLFTLHAGRALGYAAAPAPGADEAAAWRNRAALLVFVTLCAVAGWYGYRHAAEFRLLAPLSWPAMVGLVAAVFAAALGNGLLLRLVTGACGLRLSFSQWFGIARATSLANLVLPFPGGTAVKALYLKRVHALDYAHFVAALFLANGIRLLVFSALALPVLLAGPVHHPLLAAVAAGGALGPLIVLTAAHRLPRRLLPAWRPLHVAAAAWDVVRARPRTVPALFLLNTALFAVSALGYAAAFAAFGVRLSAGTAAVLAAFALYPVLLKLVPGDFGVKDVLVVAVAARFGGMGLNEAAHAAALHRLVSVASVLLLAPSFAGVLRRGQAPAHHEDSKGRRGTDGVCAARPPHTP
jgi:hypothetical protein